MLSAEAAGIKFQDSSNRAVMSLNDWKFEVVGQVC